jgi:hypothetical protein
MEEPTMTTTTTAKALYLRMRARQRAQRRGEMTTYSINAMDSTETAGWMHLCATLTPGNQDSGRCRYTVTTDRPGDLAAALESDPDRSGEGSLLG